MNNQPNSTIFIGDNRISLDDPTYFIAEIGSNFDQDLERAKDLIYLAKDAGADAVKFQHYTASSLVSDEGFKKLGGNQSHQSKWKKSVFDTYDDASLNSDWTATLKNVCDEAGVSFFTSPYSFELVNYVDEFVPAFKVGSGDITWVEIIEHMARKSKPVLLSTGASDFADVKRATDALLAINRDVVLLQCNTNYTADHDNYTSLQLNVLKEFSAMYPGIVLGLSDHMPGHVTVLGAVALGARVIEKHFTDSTERYGPDHGFAMTPKSWREMVDRTRELEMSLGDGIKKIEDNEKDTVVLQRRCIRVSRDVEQGEVLSRDDLSMLRPCPADGIPPYEVGNLIGKKLLRSIGSGSHVTKNDVEVSE